MSVERVKKHFLDFAVLVGLLILGSPAAYPGPGAGTLFGTDGANMNLVTVDITNGANLSSIATGVNFQALAVDPSDGTIFAGAAGGSADVYTVTPAGVPTFLADADITASSITAMDFDDNGVLFAVLDGDTLATINTSTGLATTVGAISDNIGILFGFESIAFAPDGTLYGMQLNTILFTDTTLYTIDPLTGLAVLDSVITDQFALPPDGGVTGLQFDCEGILYAGTAFDDFLFAGGNLGTVAPSPTRTYVPIGGPSVASFQGDLAALAFADSCDGGGGGDDPIEVIVDISPGPNTASWKCKQSNKQFTVAIESTVDFDATEIDADTVRFGREGSETLAAARHQHKGAAKRHEEDVNGDQLTDLVFHFRLDDTDFSCADIPGGDKDVIVTGTITGLLTDGETEFVGTDDFEIRK